MPAFRVHLAKRVVSPRRALTKESHKVGPGDEILWAMRRTFFASLATAPAFLCVVSDFVWREHWEYVSSTMGHAFALYIVPALGRCLTPAPTMGGWAGVVLACVGGLVCGVYDYVTHGWMAYVATACVMVLGHAAYWAHWSRRRSRR